MGLQVPGRCGKAQGPGLIPGPRQVPPPLLRVLSDLFYPELHGGWGSREQSWSGDREWGGVYNLQEWPWLRVHPGVGVKGNK